MNKPSPGNSFLVKIWSLNTSRTTSNVASTTELPTLSANGAAYLGDSIGLSEGCCATFFLSAETSTKDEALRKGNTRRDEGEGDTSTLVVRTTGVSCPLARESGRITTSWPSNVSADPLESNSVSALTLSDVTITG